MDKLRNLFGSGPFSEVVEEATSELLLQPDWAKNIQICDQVNVKLDNARHVVRAIRRRTNHSNNKVQYLALVLLESCIKNCGMRFHQELAQSSDLQRDLVRMASRDASGQGEHMTQEQARKIILNLHLFAQGRRDLQPLALLMRQAQERGARFDGVTREDWSRTIGSVGAAVVQDARNYHQADMQRQPQRPPAAKGPPPPGTAYPGQQFAAAGQQPFVIPPPPAGTAPGQAYIVQGPGGQQLLVQALPPGAQVQGQQPQRAQQQQHHDPAAGAGHRTQEQVAADVAKEFEGAYEQVSLMNEMLNVGQSEGQDAAALLADEVLSALAEQLRSMQGRVAHVVAVGAGGDRVEQFLELNDSLVSALERYSTMSGGVGIPPATPDVVIPADTEQGQAVAPAPQRAQQPPAGEQEEAVDSDVMAAIRLSQMEADERAAQQQREMERLQQQPAAEQQQAAPPAAPPSAPTATLDDIFGAPAAPPQQQAAPPAAPAGAADDEDDFVDFARSRERSRVEQDAGGTPAAASGSPPQVGSSAPAAPPPVAPPPQMGVLPPPPPPAAAEPEPPAAAPPVVEQAAPAPEAAAATPPPAAPPAAAAPAAPPAAEPAAAGAADGGDDDDEFDDFLNTKLTAQAGDTIN